MKKLLLLSSFLIISGCSTIDSVKKYWPRDHDPALFDKLVQVDVEIRHIDCEKPDWSQVLRKTEELSTYSEWRDDPQKENMKGLFDHVQRMNQGGSKVFCELGKKTSHKRIEAAKSAWRGR